jgi:hypothetical protein
MAGWYKVTIGPGGTPEARRNRITEVEAAFGAKFAQGGATTVGKPRWSCPIGQTPLFVQHDPPN